MAAQVRRITFNDEEIGMGFNSESGLAVGTALENFTVQEEPTAPGQEVSAAIKIINSHEELMDSLDLSFEAQGRYGFYSASAKAAFAESSHYNSTSTFLVARCIVQNPFRRGRNWSVRPAAQALLDSMRFEEFKTAFGDSFVRGLQTGGEFYSVIRITSVSSSTQSELSASLEAEMNGLVAAGSFKGQFQQANSSSSTKSEFSSTMFQRAGSGAQSAVVIDIGEVTARYKNFPDIARTSAFAYETEVATYDTLPLPVPTPEEQEDFLFALRAAREKKLFYIQAQNDLEFALQHPEFFQDLPARDTLLSAAAAYTKLLNAVIDHAVRLARGQIAPPRVFDPSAITPPLAEPTPILFHRLVPAVAGPTPQAIGPGPDTLRDGQRLNIDEKITSSDGNFYLLMQRDGNLVLYDKGNQAYWATDTVGSNASFAAMQSDGNFVLYTNDGRPVWASNTDGHHNSYIIIQNDRNLVIYQDNNNPIWASNTATS